MNALFSRLTKKTLIVATIAISFGVAGGLAILSTTGDVTAAGPAMSPGFIKGPNPAKADPAMVDADSNSCQPESYGRDAACRATGSPIRHQAIGGIAQVPEVIKIGTLDVIEKFIIARKRMRNCRECSRRSAFL